MLLPGISVSTSADDFAPIKQMQLEKFDGNTWQLFGEVISGPAADDLHIATTRVAGDANRSFVS
jgi:hypothetical protein